MYQRGRYSRGENPEEDVEMACFTEGPITKVEPESALNEAGEPDGWYCTYDGWTIRVRNVGTAPRVGDILRTYGFLGYEVHGQSLNGEMLWYESPEHQEEQRQLRNERMDAERKERFEAARPELDAAYDELPENFRARLDRFRAGNPNFRWEHESYEMGCCTQAVSLAAYCAAQAELCPLTPVEVLKLAQDDAERRRTAGVSDDHSGNSMGMVFRLAFLQLEHPELVALEHGALTRLIGCRDYGCTHPEAPVAAD